jgi:hypothetical protein
MGEPPYADLHPMKVRQLMKTSDLRARADGRSCSSFPKIHPLNLTIPSSPERSKISSDNVSKGIQER